MFCRTQFNIARQAKAILGEQEMQELIEASTVHFPPRPNLTEPDGWHIWKPLQDDIVDAGSDQPGATAVIPRCLIEYVEDVTCAAIGNEPLLKSVKREDQGRYMLPNALIHISP